MTLVYLARQSKAVMYVTPEAVNFDPKLGLDNPSAFFAFAFAWLYGSA